jgi:hypothetical protein
MCACFNVFRGQVERKGFDCDDFLFFGRKLYLLGGCNAQ